MMGYRYDELAPGEVYHVFARSVERRLIFLDNADRFRFVELLTHCLPQGPIRSFSISKRLKQKSSRLAAGTGLIDLMGYCLMDNHVHLLIHQNVEGGTSIYMQRLLTSYAKYFNTRRKRSGSLFINPFKAVLVDQDEQLLHVSRYIHLNPYTAHMTENPFDYSWSSLSEYIVPRPIQGTCHRELIANMMNAVDYKAFIEDHADYARSLADIKYQLIDYDD